MYKIMIAEERQTEYQRMRRILSMLPVRAEVLPCTRDMVSFVRTLSEKSPDLILTDLRLSGDFAFNPLEYIRYRHCPAEIVIITDQEGFELTQSALRFGAFACLKRPVKEKELLECVTALCRNQARQKTDRTMQEKNGILYRKFLELSEKEFMMSLLLGAPDFPSFREVSGQEGAWYYAAAVKDCPAQYEQGEGLAELKRRAFSEEICLALCVKTVLYLLIVQEKRPDRKTQGRWKQGKLEALYRQIREAGPYTGIGISEGTENIKMLSAEIRQARMLAENAKQFCLPDHEEKETFPSDQEIRYTERAIGYMERHYGTEIRLCDAAAAAGVSPSYLSRMMHRVKKKTFSELLTEIRMSHALELLSERRLSVQAISELCGYSNISYFYRVMRKYTGNTIKETRLTLKQAQEGNGFREGAGTL